MPNQEKDDKASSSPSSSGYSGYGGEDSPGERGGRGTTGSSSNTSTSSSKGSSSSSSSYSGTVGSPNDRTSYGDSRMGTGRDSSSIGGRDNSNSDSGYSGYGGDDSPSERGGRGTSGSPSSVSTTNVADRFDSGSGGLGQAYRDMAASATQAGISNLAGDSYSRAPSFRESEISGMAKLEQMNQDARQALLDTIAGPESAGRYDVMYGGGRFTNFDDHPGVRHTITSGPNAGKTTTAAGRYQFLEPTWQDQKAKLDLKDYSPKNQDAAAFNLAKEAYSRKTGRDLETDLVSQNPERIAGIGKALSGTWTSLPSGIEQGISSNKFTNTYLSNFNEASNRKGDRVANAAPDTRVAENAYRDPSVTVRSPDYNPQTAKDSAGQKAINQIAAPSTDRFKSTYLATPETGPTPQAKPQQELTTGQKIMAGAIDLGSGFIPGVGTGLGIVNAGLQLTGNQTIGERIVRGASAGTTPLEDQAGRSTADNGAVEMQKKAEEAVTATPAATAAVTPTVEKFVSTYLRPTPREKWSRG